MTGLTMKELYDALIHNHEVEMIYQKVTYSIEPDSQDEEKFLTIWKCIDPPVCICRYFLSSEKDDKENINDFLSIPCFKQKSFLSISKEVEITGIW